MRKDIRTLVVGLLSVALVPAVWAESKNPSKATPVPGAPTVLAPDEVYTGPIVTARVVEQNEAGFTVDVFVDRVSDLRAVQASPEVVGGEQGKVELVEVIVDKDRPDYVFYPNEAVAATDKNLGRVANVLMQGGMDVTEPSYVGTFVYRFAPDAKGTFQLNIRTGRLSLMRNSSGTPVEFRVQGPQAVTMGQVIAPVPADKVRRGNAQRH
jgi:hypothetical protein